MKFNFRKNLPWISLFLLWWLLFWGESWEARLTMDGMTYGALAKHILSTGDWKNLHYSSQAYSDYYQHPPLVMWMTAILFKFLGASEWSAKILPSLLGLGSLIAVVIWGTLLRSEFCGFLAGFVLLTSTRYIKYGANLMLDGPLGFWMIWGGLLIWLLVNGGLSKANNINDNLRSSSVFLAMGAGVCMAAAFLTKGLPALVLPILFVALVIFYVRSVRDLKEFSLCFGTSIIVAGTFIAAWLYFGDGIHYLQNYWTQSVKSRLGEGTLASYFAPTKNLFKGYWPWLPFYFMGIRSLLLDLGSARKPFSRLFLFDGLPLFFSLAILAGFSISGFFLEHYLVPFYPFAALVVAPTLHRSVRKYERQIVFSVFILTLIYANILAVFPLHIQADDYKDPQRVILKRASFECKSDRISRIYISDQTTGLWWGLALGAWNTPWDARVINPASVPKNEKNSLLLIEKAVPISDGWEPTDLNDGGYRILQVKGSQACLF